MVHPVASDAEGPTGRLKQTFCAWHHAKMVDNAVGSLRQLLILGAVGMASLKVLAAGSLSSAW
jgi:hypothetical protein